MTRQTRLKDYEPISRLPAAQKRDYLGCVVGGRTVREWADEIDRKPGTVGQNLSKAKDRLGANE